ncbi:MAG: hypothetical protein J6L77_06435 [Coprococcus sp.]|nr:hypothetical protein [Coprococcus sp.]
MKKRMVSFLMSFLMALSLVSPNIQVFAKENHGDNSQMQGEILETSEAGTSEAEITTEASEEVTTEEVREEATTEASTEEQSTEETSSEEEGSTEDISTEEEATTEGSIVFYMDNHAIESNDAIGAEAEGIMTYADTGVNEGYTDYADYLDVHTILVDGKPYDGTDRLDPAASFTQHLEFTLTRADMKANGLQYYFQFPEHITIGNVGSEDSQLILYNTGGRTIGTYYILDDVLYVTFPGYYESVTAYFNLEANWEDVKNKSNVDILWPGEKEKVLFDLSDLNISKAMTDFEADKDGNQYAVFTVRISPKSPDLGINGIKFEDTYYSTSILLTEDYFSDSKGKKHDIQVKSYGSDGSLKNTTYYEYADVAVKSGSNTTMTIGNLSAPANGYIAVQYAVKIDYDTYMKLGAQGKQAAYKNKATASYDIYNEDGTYNDTLSSSAERDGYFGTETGWVYKKVGTGVYTDDKTNLVVPYTVGINRDRLYSLGGSIVQDAITQFDDSYTVTYDMSTNPTIDITDKNGSSNRTLEWKVLEDSLYAELVSALYKSSSKTAMDNILTGTGSYATLRNKLKTALGVSELTNEIVSTYLFTDSAAEDFTWITPLDKTPTHYMLHYNTLVPSACDGNTNSASMWYTEYNAIPPGPGTGYENPYKKVMEIDKSNDGIYEDKDGNYLVDWHISLTVPAGSHFDHIALEDVLQSYYIPADVLSPGHSVYDWFYAMGDDYYYDNNAEIIWEESDRIFTIYSDSTDAAVQKTVENLKGQLLNFRGPLSGGNNWSISYDKTAFLNMNNINAVKYYGGTGYMDNNYIAAGQFNDEGYSWTPKHLLFYITELPLSDKTYTINIDYTTQINPLLVEYLPEILENKQLDFITMTNTVNAYQLIKNSSGEYRINSRYAKMIAQASASYYIGKEDIDDNIFKDVEKYDEDNKVIDYEVRINPLDSIVTTHTEYQLEDMISYTGVTYQNQSFVLKDGAGSVIWSTNPKVKAAAKYSGYDSYIKLKLNNQTNGSSSYVLTLDNTTGKFDGADDKLLHMVLTYSVDAPTYDTASELSNTVNLLMFQDVADSESDAKIVVGSATSNFTYDKALDKALVDKPTSDNHYKASFEVIANLESDNAAELKHLKAGDTFTIKDKLSNNLNLDMDNIKVLYFDKTTETYKSMKTSAYSMRYDADTNSLYVTITVQSGIKKYKLAYDAYVDGTEGDVAQYDNEASVLNSSIETDIVSERVYIQKYDQGADAITYQIKFVKYDGDNLNKRLGAAFNLYYWNKTSKTWVKLSQNSGDTFRTDSATGILTLNNELCSLQDEQLITADTWYKLVEVEAASHYMLDDTPIYYYVTDTGETATVPTGSGITDYSIVTVGQDRVYELYIPNEKLSFKLQKVDAVNKDIVLEGAEFAVYSDAACTKLVQKLTADENNVYRASDLDIGNGNISYYLKETKAPKEYLLNDKVYEVKVENSVLQYIKSIDGADTLQLDDSGVMFLFGDASIYGKLEITKTITAYSSYSVQKHADDEFAFGIIFRDETGTEINEAFPYEHTDADGNKTTGTYYSGDVIYLKHGERLLFNKVADGITYKVTEVKYLDYQTSVSVTDTAGTDSRNVSAYSVSGTVQAGEQDTVEYENALKGSLKLRKEVESEAGFGIPDGFTISVYNWAKTLLYATGEYHAELGVFECTYQDASVRFISEENGFTLEGLPTNAYFTITEENADIENYEYTVSSSYYGTVRADGSIETNRYINSGSDTIVTITNTYTTCTDVNLEARKALSGRDLIPGEFTFGLYDDANKLVEQVNNQKYGVIQFKTLKFTETDTYHYTIKEIPPQDAVRNADGTYSYKGITYTDDVIDVTIVTSYDADDQLVADVTYSIDGTEGNTFANTYEASGSLVLTADKSLENLKLAADKFSFRLKEGGTVKSTAKNTAAGKVTFAALKYDLKDVGKTFTYTISEVIPAGAVNNGDGTYTLEHYTYGATEYTVTVQPVDNKDGTLSFKVTGASPVTATDEAETYQIDYDADKAAAFVNEYATETTTSFAMTKKLNNHRMAAEQFTFTATEYTDSKFTTVKKDAGGTAITYKGKSISAAKDKAANITFEEMTYTIADAGTHYYQIVEDIPAGAKKNADGTYTYKGVTYSALKATATVKVSYNNVTGVLSTTTSYGSAGTAFVNTYHATGKATLTGTKVLDGRDIVDGEFTFSVKDTAGKTVSTGSSDENGVITFTDIEYDEQDIGKTYTYTVTEDKKAAVGVTYSDAKYTVKVSIADHHDGTLDVTVLYDGAAASNIVFTNKYEASADVVLNATKMLDSKPLADGQFRFQMLDEQDKVVATATNDADGNIVFSRLTYYINGTDDNMGSHNYRVVEVNDGVGGYTYDDTEYEVTVVATDNGDGTIGIAVTGASLVTSEAGVYTYKLDCETDREWNFDNQYEATGSITFAGVKELIGLTTDNTREIMEGEFSFTITEYTDDTYTETVKKPVEDMDAGGDADAGTDTDAGGDADAGTDTDAGDDTNTEPEYVAVEYTCENDAEGKILYPEITYNRNADIDDVGTHYYKIVENKGTAGGVTYSEEVYYVTVEVSDNDDGTLKAHGSENYTKLDFTNHYDASGSVTFDVTKQTVDKNGAVYHDLDEAGESFGSLFRFEAYEILADGSKELVADAETGVNGKATFDEIVYDLDDIGTHQYRIVEVNETLGGYTYDATAYSVTVNVSDNGDGTLKVEITDSEGNVIVEAGRNIRYSVSYKNTYDASGSITLEGSKTVENLDKMIKNNVLKKGEFTFTVTEKVNNKDVVVATGKNDTDGNILFTQIQYGWDDIGSHIYTITEDTDDRVSNIVYDDKPVTVMVQVTNEGNGTLGVDVQYVKAEQEIDKAEFANASTETKISKVDEEGNPVKNAKLGIYNENGKLVASITTTEEMQVVYGLDTGVKYTLRETETPTGYKTAADISFKLNEEGSLIVNGDKVEHITMVDEKVTTTTTDTGDSSNASAAMMVLLISTLGIVVLMMYKKKYMTV